MPKVVSCDEDEVGSNASLQLKKYIYVICFRNEFQIKYTS